jgi:hypothetical protein
MMDKIVQVNGPFSSTTFAPLDPLSPVRSARFLPLVLVLGSMLMAGCPYVEPRDDIDFACLDNPPKPVTDMTMITPPPKCAAAAGLAGDNLLCVDFKDVQTLGSLTGWTFSCVGGSSWGTMDGLLQVNNFGMFMDECTAKLPTTNLNDADKQKYKALTLSLIHRIDLNDPEQKAQIFLNDSNDTTRLMYFATGKKNPSRQQTTITLDKADLPAMINNAPQWQFKLSSTLKVGRQGWQIESIAVNGKP